ncbi:MAG TPA: C40 family peptidase [Gemmatimonadaceae bacterium]
MAGILGVNFDDLLGGLDDRIGGALQTLGDAFGGAAGGLWSGATGLASRALSPFEQYAQSSPVADSLARLGGGPYNPLSRLGGGAYDPLSRLGGAVYDPLSRLNPFGQPSQPQQQPANAPQDSYGATSDGSADPAHAPYRPIIEKYARQFGVDPDAVQALMMIESPSGDPNAHNPSGASGLMQVVPYPGRFGPGENPFDPDTNIREGVKYYAAMIRQFGDPRLAAAAYQGGPGAIVNGQARGDISDGNLTPAQYAARWQQNYDRLKASAQAPAGAGGNVVSTASKLAGVPYQLGGRRAHGGDPSQGVDCSEYTAWVWEQHGVQLPWNAWQQAQATQRIDMSQLQPGDLVFYANTDPSNPQPVTHVGVYAGNGKFWNAQDQGVMLADMNNQYWASRYWGAGRVRQPAVGGGGQNY